MPISGLRLPHLLLPHSSGPLSKESTSPKARPSLPSTIETWPQSYVIRKFINGLSLDFDLFLTTWELGITKIPITNNAGLVTQAAVTLEQATNAAVQFKASQKERASQTALFSSRTSTGRFNSGGNEGSNKRKLCSNCGRLHPPPCFKTHPELKPNG
ncbi:hypothetical protein F5B17DRAFT_270927 [Nemania serpens]|nr:hypothetical protein F5B17DRAFT_270927 [Nemania serpens]